MDTLAPALRPETDRALKRSAALLASVYDTLVQAALDASASEDEFVDGELALLADLGSTVEDMQRNIRRTQV